MLKAAQTLAGLRRLASAPADRPALEPIWLKYFPNEKSRASRHTHITKGAPFVTGDFLAYVGN